MEKTLNHPYEPPRIVGQADVLLERSFLTGSVVDALNMGGVDTAAQEVEEKDFASGDFNFNWE